MIEQHLENKIKFEALPGATNVKQVHFATEEQSSAVSEKTPVRH